MIKGLPRKACGIPLLGLVLPPLKNKSPEQRQGGQDMSWGYVANLKINLNQQNNMVEYCTIRVLARMPVFWLMRSYLNFDKYDHHQVSLFNQPTNFRILPGRKIVFDGSFLEAETHQSEDTLKGPILGDMGRIYEMSTSSSHLARPASQKSSRKTILPQTSWVINHMGMNLGSTISIHTFDLTTGKIWSGAKGRQCCKGFSNCYSWQNPI